MTIIIIKMMMTMTIATLSKPGRQPRKCQPEVTTSRSNRAVVNKSLASLKDVMAKQNPTHDQKFLFYLVFFFDRQPKSDRCNLCLLKFIFPRTKMPF